MQTLKTFLLIISSIFILGFIHDTNMFKEENISLKKQYEILVDSLDNLNDQLIKKAIYMKNFEQEYVAVLPLKGNIIITSDYKTNHRPNHKGIDMFSESDTVFAIRSGIAESKIQVDSNGKLVGYGKYVKITDPNYVTYYGHLQKVIINDGVVKQNQPIGIMGSTGRSTGKHLHLEIEINPKRLLWK